MDQQRQVVVDFQDEQVQKVLSLLEPYGKLICINRLFYVQHHNSM